MFCYFYAMYILKKYIGDEFIYVIHSLSSVQPLSHVWHFVAPWTAAHQDSLSITT